MLSVEYIANCTHVGAVKIGVDQGGVAICILIIEGNMLVVSITLGPWSHFFCIFIIKNYFSLYSIGLSSIYMILLTASLLELQICLEVVQYRDGCWIIYVTFKSEIRN